MAIKNRNIIIFNKYKRLARLWQFFFTSSGLIMVATIVAGIFFTKQLVWTPLSFVDLGEIMNNQLTITEASFAGLDKNKEPFNVKIAKAYKENNNSDVLFIENIEGNVVRFNKDKKINSKITALKGKYLIKEKKLIFFGDVNVISSNGDKLFTKELIIKL